MIQEFKQGQSHAQFPHLFWTLNHSSDCVFKNFEEMITKVNPNAPQQKVV